MRYELYAILLPSGANYFVGSYASMNKALSDLNKINSTIYRGYAVLTKIRKHCPPIAIMSGVFVNGGKPRLVQDKSLIKEFYPNPIQQNEAGQKHWEEITKNVY